ncbi:hypothetical protein ALQ20_101320 [Pseudomonas syringae pv. atrofaciens]|nr:hypothetical protein ALQ20_101320 [Pseudomonas syringae pv. atrofaciens]
MHWATLRVVLQRNVMLCLSSLHIKALFYRDVTDDADRDVSDRGFGHFGPIKVTRRGAKR